jgi:ribosomal protein L7Ae-like RNA K-turn-binding protein
MSSAQDSGLRHGGQTPDDAAHGKDAAVSDDGMTRCLQLIGLAVRGRRAVAGSDVVFEKIRDRTAALVFLAADAGMNAAKKYRDKCAFYHIPLVERFDRSQLSHACGRQTVVIAVTDPGFAAAISSCIGEILGGEAFDKTSGV